MALATPVIPAHLVDSYGRQMGDLRISITDRCNFRCVYCMPEEGLRWLKNDKVLTVDEIVRVAGLFVKMGIRGIRLTGGEPTVRAGLPDLIRRLNPLLDEGLQSLSLTTNGFRLKELAGPLADAGLTRINVSLDSLVRDKFHRITRRDCLHQVLEGLEELERHPTIRPIKVNAVAMRGFTEDEVIPFAELARRKQYVVRFIEFMPLDADGNWQRDQVLAGREIYEMIHAWKPLAPVSVDPSSTSRVYRFADGIGEIGFINPVSEPFCSTCDRLRITADGQIRTCLFSIDEWDLRGPMRDGAEDWQLAEIIQRAVGHKELKHHINEGPAFHRASRSMSQIGG
ncbi:MAG: GTP 3',8-cyclase MoaA [Chloroflexota bacterium]|nr:MAG: GTP 3',8-cyclase MoaA [Chloroflexota bacterium]